MIYIFFLFHSDGFEERQNSAHTVKMQVSLSLSYSLSLRAIFLKPDKSLMTEATYHPLLQPVALPSKSETVIYCVSENAKKKKWKHKDEWICTRPSPAQGHIVYGSLTETGARRNKQCLLLLAFTIYTAVVMSGIHAPTSQSNGTTTELSAGCDTSFIQHLNHVTVSQSWLSMPSMQLQKVLYRSVSDEWTEYDVSQME